MGEAFFKALRWFLFIVCIVFGVWAFEKIEAGGLRFGMLAVIGFGGAYLMSGSWRKLPPKPMVLSILSVGLCAFLAQYVPDDVLYRAGVSQILNFYMIWVGLTFIIGVPFMMFIFSKYDD